jgi:hypothetical protein
MAESYHEPEFSRAEFSAEERARVRRMLWYNDRADFLWTTIRRWAVAWTALAVATALFKDQIRWVVKAVFTQ